MAGKGTVKVVRDAGTGRFTKKENAQRHPEKTVTETVKRGGKKG